VKIYNSIEDFQKVSFPVLTAGTFDGVHLGHLKIISRIREIAKSNDGESVLLTFTPHPRQVIFPEQTNTKLLNNNEEKIGLIEKAGINNLIIHPFTSEFSRISSLEFVRDLLVKKIGIKKLVVGYNHQFGKNREGSLKHLLEYGPLYGFDVEEIPAKDIDNINISSTKIRNALTKGDVGLAKSYLGYDYFITGRVIKGDGIGKTLNFPTANIKVSEKLKLIPADGVYAVNIKVKNTTFKGMMNIGIRPTVGNHNNAKQSKIEINLFDFNENIYDEIIEVRVISRIRNEIKFENLNALKEQLIKDQNESIEILNK